QSLGDGTLTGGARNEAGIDGVDGDEIAEEGKRRIHDLQPDGAVELTRTLAAVHRSVKGDDGRDLQAVPRNLAGRGDDVPVRTGRFLDEVRETGTSSPRPARFRGTACRSRP